MRGIYCQIARIFTLYPDKRRETDYSFYFYVRIVSIRAIGFSLIIGWCGSPSTPHLMAIRCYLFIIEHSKCGANAAAMCEILSEGTIRAMSLQGKNDKNQNSMSRRRGRAASRHRSFEAKLIPIKISDV